MKRNPWRSCWTGRCIRHPTLQSQITNSGIITGNFSQKEIAYLTRVLDAGALEARLSPEPIAVSVLGPSLGADNLDRGFQAFIWAIIVVAIFMLTWYFFAGFVADVALLCNGIIIFGVMAMMQGTFTLPGLAGVVLTMGMAVDANVLIYERIREEIQIHGARDLREAIREGYNRVYSTIVDANLTNLIVCAVLLLMQPTTEVKGFALTLTIGIIATLFTSLFVTRVHLRSVRECSQDPHPADAGHRRSAGGQAPPAQNQLGRSPGRTSGPSACCWSSVRSSCSLPAASRCSIRSSVVACPSRCRHATTVAAEPDAPTHGSGIRPGTHPRGSGSGRARGHVGEPAAPRIRASPRSSPSAKPAWMRSGQTVADGFQVKVSNPPGVGENESIQDLVEAQLLAEFGDELDISPGRTFTGVGSPTLCTVHAAHRGRVAGRNGRA